MNISVFFRLPQNVFLEFAVFRLLPFIQNIHNYIICGDTHMTFTLRGVGYKAKARCYRRLGLGLASVLDVQSFFIKDNRIFALTRRVKHWQEIFLLTLESECIHPSMIPLHCLWPKSNSRTRGQFECDVTWFCFCFDFVHSHARCGCCSIICLRFQIVQIKQFDCKMNAKSLNILKTCPEKCKVKNYLRHDHFLFQAFGNLSRCQE